MADRLTPGPVGRLTEPSDGERARLLAEVRYNTIKMLVAHSAAEHLSRLADQAAVYARYGAEVPERLRDAIATAERGWESARWK